MPRAGLTPASVTEAGAALADEVGFDQLSMGLVAERLARQDALALQARRRPGRSRAPHRGAGRHRAGRRLARRHPGASRHRCSRRRSAGDAHLRDDPSGPLRGREQRQPRRAGRPAGPRDPPDARVPLGRASRLRPRRRRRGPCPADAAQHAPRLCEHRGRRRVPVRHRRRRQLHLDGEPDRSPVCARPTSPGSRPRADPRSRPAAAAVGPRRPSSCFMLGP